MPFSISLADYKMLHPDSAEFPTLSQSGLLAILLQKKQHKAARLALRQAKRRARRQAARVWLSRWRVRLRLPGFHQAEPAFTRAARQP